MLKYLSLFIVICSFCISVFAAHRSLDTERDRIVCDLNLWLELMHGCKKSQKYNNKIEMSYCQTPKLEWIKHREMVKNLLDKYIHSQSGLTKTDKWQLVSYCLKLPTDFQDFCDSRENFIQDRIPEKTLIKAAQRMVTSSAKSTNNTGEIMLQTLFRGGEHHKIFTDLLRDSLTWQIPMGRAFDKFTVAVNGNFEDCSDDAYLKFLWSELAQEKYGRDDSLVATIKYLTKYIEYEIIIAKHNKELYQKYPALANNTHKLAEIHIASLLAFYVVSEFLINNCGFDSVKGKKFSGINNLKIDYKSSDIKINEKWHDIIILMLQEPRR